MQLLAFIGTSSAQNPETVWRFEDFEDTNGSIYKTLYFSTVPGVNYVLQSSHDLDSWSKVTDYYGLGHEYAVSLFEVESLLNPPSGPPVESPPIVSLQLRSIENGNGVTLSWRSMDDGQTKQYHLATASLATEWSGILIMA